jgi:hypothetical protein
MPARSRHEAADKYTAGTLMISPSRWESSQQPSCHIAAANMPATVMFIPHVFIPHAFVLLLLLLLHWRSLTKHTA